MMRTDIKHFGCDQPSSSECWFWTESSLPAVVSSSTDHIFIVVGEADVGYVGRVAKEAFVFGLKSEKNKNKAQCGVV